MVIMYSLAQRSSVGLKYCPGAAAGRRSYGGAALAARDCLPRRWSSKHYPDRAVLTGREDLSSVLGEALYDFGDRVPVGVATDRDDG